MTPTAARVATVLAAIPRLPVLAQPNTAGLPLPSAQAAERVSSVLAAAKLNSTRERLSRRIRATAEEIKELAADFEAGNTGVAESLAKEAGKLNGFLRQMKQIESVASMN